MPVYTYTTLDDPSATIGTTRAFGINSLGQIVGDYGDNAGGHGFVESGGIYTPLDDPLATNGTSAYGINTSGQIVGYYTNNTGYHGFLYNPNGGTYITLDDPSGSQGFGKGTQAQGKNSQVKACGCI